MGEVTDVSPSIDNALDWRSRSCGHYVCNCDVYRTLIWSYLGLGVGPQFYFLFFISCFLAVAVGALIVPPEQRKKCGFGALDIIGHRRFPLANSIWTPNVR